MSTTNKLLRYQLGSGDQTTNLVWVAVVQMACCLQHP